MANIKRPVIDKWPSNGTWDAIYEKIGTFKELAKFTGRSEPMVKNWFNNVSPIPDFLARKIANHCSIDFFDIRPDLKP